MNKLKSLRKKLKELKEKAAKQDGMFQRGICIDGGISLLTAASEARAKALEASARIQEVELLIEKELNPYKIPKLINDK